MLKKIFNLTRNSLSVIKNGIPMLQSGTTKTAPLFSNVKLQELAELYKDYPIQPLSYATVKDFCDGHDQMRPFAELNGDLKDVQRPWTIKTLLALLPKAARVLEIGAGEPWVGDFLSRLGHDVWICDPYDGTGNGPIQFDRYRSECPDIKFVRSFFNDSALDVPPHYFDAIFSISVLEHVPSTELPAVFAGIRKYLKPSGYSIHSVDHVHKGNGAAEHLLGLRRINALSGNTDSDLDSTLGILSSDIETYYLSAESHNRWRSGVPYDEFPMRVCVSVHFVTPRDRIGSSN